MGELTVYGKAGSSALERREDLKRYFLQVDWADEQRWRETAITLPTGRQVKIDQYVGENFGRPRMYHPEYALAIELLVANAVSEAKRRGFRLVAVEMGVWAYRTFTQLGKRITTIGVPDPIVLEDGRTTSRTAHQWVDLDGEGVIILPWANGDQLIRLKDERGYYVVPVDERTADGARCRQAMSWRTVKDYPALTYEQAWGWSEVPLLEAADPMVEQLDCEWCKFLQPVDPWPFVTDRGKRVCRPCEAERKRLRHEAKIQGWDYDKRRPAMAPSHFKTVVNPRKCPHKWGMQMHGTRNVGAPDDGLKVSFECILCGKPTPDDRLTVRHRLIRRQQEERDHLRRGN